jgi:hypothetical protein
MTTTFATRLIDLQGVGDRWALILGGVTRQGNRRARRIATKMLKEGLDVVWFDGFEERSKDDGTRVPLDLDELDGSLTIVGYGESDAKSFAGRLRTGSRMRSNPLTRALWRVLLRRLGTILRPRAGWLIIRPAVEQLSSLPAPRLIVYCDVYSITSGWYSGQLWRSTPILSGLPERRP